MITLNQIADLAAAVKNEEIVELNNGIQVRVRNRLPLEEKVHLIEEIVIACAVGTESYFNPLKLRTLTALKVLDASTDINVFEDEEMDIYKLYDILNDAGVFTKVLPRTDFQEVLNWSYDSAEAFINYNHSISGILAELKDSFNTEDLKEQLTSIMTELKDNPDLQKLLSLYETEGLSN